jgi:hypothetical protein
VRPASSPNTTTRNATTAAGEKPIRSSPIADSTNAINPTDATIASPRSASFIRQRPRTLPITSSRFSWAD